MQLTVKQVRTAAKKYKYLVLTDYYGRRIGVNSKAVFLGENPKHKPSERSGFTGYSPADINEYITHKIPFETI